MLAIIRPGVLFQHHPPNIGTGTGGSAQAVPLIPGKVPTSSSQHWFPNKLDGARQGPVGLAIIRPGVLINPLVCDTTLLGRSKTAKRLWRTCQGHRVVRRISQPISSHRGRLLSNGAMGRVPFMVPRLKQVQVNTKSKVLKVGPASLLLSKAQMLLQTLCIIHISL